MSEWIRLPNCCLNLDQYSQIQFIPEGLTLITNGFSTITITGDDAIALMDELEKRYGLMTAPSARLYSDPQEQAYEPA